MTNNPYEYNHVEDVKDETSPISNMVLICGGISLFITLYHIKNTRRLVNISNR